MISNTEINETYKGVVNMKANESIIKGDSKQQDAQGFTTQAAMLDTDKMKD